MSQNSVLLTPDVNANILASQHKESTVDFYCHSLTAYHIELWTNLSENKEWIGIPFTRQNTTDYSLKIQIATIKPDSYEYTLRFRQGKDSGDWSWYSTAGNNGQIRIVPFSNKVSAPVQIGEQFETIFSSQIDDVYLQHFKLCPKAASSVPLKIPHNMHSFLVFLRKGSCWTTPVAGYSSFEHRNTSEKWQMIIYLDSVYGHVHLWTIASQHSDCWFSPSGKSSISACRSNQKDNDVHLLISSIPLEKSFKRLIETTIKYYQEEVCHLNVQPSQNSPEPILLDRLGYCTWNAFGKEVSLENIHKAIESLADHEIPIGYLLIDDGWQETDKEQQFGGFDACPEKFPNGLKQVISQLKGSHPFLKHIGIWHTLWGYWNGISRGFAETNGCQWSNFSKKNDDYSVGILTDIDKFYNDFYAFLSGCGVDFVKVDNQGGFQDLDTDFDTKVHIWDSYRLGMVKNADRYLRSQVIHCMSLTPHILFNPIFSSNAYNSKAIFRNSDDFFPNEQASHTWHIYANAINALWTSQYPLIGDWDMFQSDHPFAEYHAASRSISGGPIYITDVPGQHNPLIVHRLIAETRRKGYTILRFCQAPSPGVNTVFRNPVENQDLITLTNTHNIIGAEEKYGVIGFWNTNSLSMKIGVAEMDSIFPDLTFFQCVAYVISGPDKGKLMLYSLNQSRNINHLVPNELIVRVEKMGSALISISQVRSTKSLLVACLGLTDKLAGINAIKNTKLYETADQENNLFTVFEVNLTHRSENCGFWIMNRSTKAMSPQRVYLDGVKLRADTDWVWCSEKSLLKVDMMVVSLNSSTRDEFCIKIFIEKA